ncbi:MAG: hypothetical protein E6G35_00595 [Actinobacteria bacterium]|nr:MAG: hypothetical protein E6G35_00595 [Actinomycetota bacterium]
MVALLATGLGGLLLGGAIGWASRRHAHWCPNDGTRLTCARCQPVLREITRTGYPVVGRVPAGLIIPLRDGNSGPGGPL